MKFLVLLAEKDHFDRWDAADEEERDAAFAAYRSFAAAVKARGRIVCGDALHRPETARTVRPGEPGRSAERAATGGPYAETVEQIGGFYVIDMPTLDDAVEAARLLPAEYTLEVRPCLGVDVG
ncbi:YCII-related protein [Beutenbergia cavernae DSM 12333]|uniref:YCII-related protein n=1 Tax=Beutenbergia cavernae (strain ATCC BAA-8 / DSM 12333 / CCUG 43141 / JCM 11478 / NBRC 16432 / NCIMB 13614 / HKI 0122) TaxID=471853 RepID=C5C5L6_BEUC1|nr:YciI family protein [Beutenbergia cavernae]ACQ80207.1 YCII-related protein [Beutenbergia cavernae DSM 12333]